MLQETLNAPPSRWLKQDWAYTQIRERVMSGQLKPGEQLNQERLAAELGISRIPLREALNRLVVEGLVQDNPHRKWVVTELPVNEVRDIYSGREVLEALLTAEAVPLVTQEVLDELAATIEAQRVYLAQGALDNFRVADRAFHTMLYKVANMPQTYGALNNLLVLSERHIRAYQSDLTRARTSIDEHHTILEAIVARDAQRACDLVRRHIRRGRDHLEGLNAPIGD